MSRYNQLDIEKDVQKYWNDNQIYEKLKNKVKNGKNFYFLDGPPYTSGKVHIGTAWNKSLKDALLRYKRMRGFNVWDRAGYDMHGLPTENATMKKLNLKDKEDIKSFGVNKFIEECKNLCISNMKVMNEDFKRLGVWMDFDNAYQSIKKEFMEGEWWLIKKAHEKGRLYRGLRTMTWCPISESALAKHELEYKTVKDKSIFVKFKIKGKDNEYLVIWTTTPWTIPFNLAVMANPDVEYVKAKVDNEIWIVASALVNVFISSVVDKKYEIVETLKGSDLEGIEYEHPFYDELREIYDNIKKESPKTHTVVMSSEYVHTDGGSGLVHCAPGCGPEDYEVGHRNNIPPFNNIDTRGVFPDNMGKFSGLVAKKGDDRFIEELKERGSLIAVTEVEHEYPHDWRYHNPVIFRTTEQWFFKVEDMKEEMIKENKNINWVPNAAFNAFDSWLNNLRDNSISKQRFWGTPIPIWVNTEDENDYIVIGSAKELEELSGEKVEDLHIDHIDDIEIKKDGKTYRRVKDILDVWVDAGTVSWNCLDYPHKEEKFRELFPADFILEGKDQIRGWFNLLHVASMIAFGRPSFKNVYMHGFVQDAQGRKMSKSQGNYILPEEVIGKYGADVLRYYMIGGAEPGQDINYNFDDMKVKARNLGILWNIHKYLIDNAKLYNINPKEYSGELEKEEKFILSRMNNTIKEATDMFESYNIEKVPWIVERLFLDLSRKYIQYTRDKTSEKRVLYAIYKVLYASLTLLSPIAPFITERIFLNLKDAFGDENESIHLVDWPMPNDGMINKEIEEEINTTESLIQSILASRKKLQMGVRWPLKRAVIFTKEKVADDIVKKMTNIKEITYNDIDVKEEVKLDYSKVEADYGPLAPKIIAKFSIDTSIVKHIDEEGECKIDIDGAPIVLTKDHLIRTKTAGGFFHNTFSKGDVFIDTNLTPELENEGYVRELSRRIQVIRKEMGLSKNDRVKVGIKGDIDFPEEAKEKIGATEITRGEIKDGMKKEFKIRDKSFIVWVKKDD